METQPVPEKEIIDRLRSKANKVRRRNLKLSALAGQGHTGGDLSVADILTILYFHVLNIDPDNPGWADRDRFIMSKGHAAGCFYTVLALRGFFPEPELDTYLKAGSNLNGHPNREKVPGVETNTGALGHGLPVAAGAALSAKIQGETWRTFVVTGDGELQEGSNWEAAMFAGHKRLDNLTVIVDRNRLQLGSATEETVRLEPLAEKWRSFGWAVQEVDGHNVKDLLGAFERLPFEAGCPSCIIANTDKGHPISFIKSRPEWHHRSMREDELCRALKELGEG